MIKLLIFCKNSFNFKIFSSSGSDFTLDTHRVMATIATHLHRLLPVPVLVSHEPKSLLLKGFLRIIRKLCLPGHYITYSPSPLMNERVAVFR